MLVLLHTYPYLFANLPLLVLMLLASKTARPSQYGRLTLLSGCACLPCAVLALIHEGTYWTPVRVGGYPLGIEDFVFSFTSGSLAWFLSSWFFRHRLVSAPRFSAFGQRSLAGGLLFGGFCGLLWKLGVVGLDNTLAGGLGAIAVLLVLRFPLIPLAAAGVLLFVPIYLLIVVVQFHLWPDYSSQWNFAAYGGRLILGVPAGEVAWAAIFAAVWPLMMGYFFDVRWAKVVRTTPGQMETPNPVRV